MSHYSADIRDNFEELEEKDVSIAGRIMAKRVMGKVSFIDIQDRQGRIQSFVARDNITPEEYKILRPMISAISWELKVRYSGRRRGRSPSERQEIVLLSKSIQVLPEKFHGLTDTDMRYRQRYVDLIMNEDVRRYSAREL